MRPADWEARPEASWSNDKEKYSWLIDSTSSLPLIIATMGSYEYSALDHLIFKTVAALGNENEGSGWTP